MPCCTDLFSSDSELCPIILSPIQLIYISEISPRSRQGLNGATMFSSSIVGMFVGTSVIMALQACTGLRGIKASREGGLILIEYCVSFVCYDTFFKSRERLTRTSLTNGAGECLFSLLVFSPHWYVWRQTGYTSALAFKSTHSAPHLSLTVASSELSPTHSHARVTKPAGISRGGLQF